MPHSIADILRTSEYGLDLFNVSVALERESARLLELAKERVVARMLAA